MMLFLHAWFWQYQDLLSGLLWVVLSILSFFLVILLINLLTYPRLQADGASSRPSAPEDRQCEPLVSVLIPARNEESCIEACVRSLLAQTYGPLEVLVLDDQSSDATAAIVQRLIDELPSSQRGRLRLLNGEPLPAQWIGKNFACYQLALHAQGELLYFTDADTVHAPGTVRAVVDCMSRYEVQLLSAHPEYVFGSLGERLLVPLLPFLMLILLPLALVSRRPEPTLSNGNGQLMCFERAAYDQIGGHFSVQDSLIEDVVLARLCKAAGYRMIFVDASALVRCRMYHSFAGVVAGFSKSHFVAYQNSLLNALGAMVFMLMVFVVLRMLITLRSNHRERAYMLLLCFLHPFSIVLECLILLNAIRWHYRKAGIVWKGRYYKR